MNEIRKTGFYFCRVKGKKTKRLLYWSNTDNLWQRTKRYKPSTYYKDSEVEIVNLEKK